MHDERTFPVSEKPELRNFVGGEHVDATDGRRMDLVDPATGEVFASAPVSAAEDVDRAYTAAAGAFPGWREANTSERALAMPRLAGAVEAHADEPVALANRNTGNPVGLNGSDEIPP